MSGVDRAALIEAAAIALYEAVPDESGQYQSWNMPADPEQRDYARDFATDVLDAVLPLVAQALQQRAEAEWELADRIAAHPAGLSSDYIAARNSVADGFLQAAGLVRSLAEEGQTK